jgi:hypothetical protein
LRLKTIPDRPQRKGINRSLPRGVPEIKNNTAVARNVGSIPVARSFTYEERD